MSANNTNILVRLIRVLIRAYQKYLSPFLGTNCCYYPTCSQYALEAVEQHGIFKGIGLALRRISRCHPLSEPGYDPVPNKTHHCNDCSNHKTI